MADIEWTEPPDLGSTRGRPRDPKITAFAEALRTRPGQWAIFRRTDNLPSACSAAHQIRNGKYPAFPAGQYEAVAREGVVYVRHVGEVAT